MRWLAMGMLLVAGSARADVRPPAAPPAPAPPVSVFRGHQAGTLEHLQSGLVCPARIGEYRRIEATVFDKFGLDVSCGYHTGTVVITLYLTRRTGTGVDAALAEAKRELLQFGADRHPQSISELRSTNGGRDWVTVLYGEDGDIHSAIWLADLDGWTLEYRATYPAVDETRVTADIAKITAIVEESAGARLALCSASPPPARRALPILDRRNLQQSSMMTSILGGAVLAEARDGKATATAPLMWCLEGPILKNNHHMLFWRAVDPKGTDARSDRITLATDGPPPTLDIAPDSLASLVEGLAKASDKPPRWIATLRQGDETLIFGYFDGRPSSDSVADLFENILAGKAKPAGGFGAEGKNITIVVPPAPRVSGARRHRSPPPHGL